MSVLSQDGDVAVRWSMAERVAALKRIEPQAAIRIVLRKTGRRRVSCRRLPRWFVVWFVIAMALFCRDSDRQVFRCLHRFRKGGTPGRSTLCAARQSVGVAPLRLLAEQVIPRQAQPETPQTFYGGMRLMGVDSFVVDVPDTPENVRAFGRPGSGRSPGAFPQARVLSLCELGTHILWKSLIQPHRRGEHPLARHIRRFLADNRLLLWDRNFLSFALVQQVRERRAPLLTRVKSNLIFTPIRRLRDGSFLAKLSPSPRHRERDDGGLEVRIIEYTFDDSGRPGSGETHRLLTTLLDERQHPAKDLIVLYHERWEQELADDELQTHQRERPVRHSQTSAGVVPELYGLLLGHDVIRKRMCDAADLADIAPRDLSFVNTLKILRCRLAEAPRSAAGLRRGHQDLLTEVAAEVLEPRRHPINPRVIKRKMSNWLKKRDKHRNFPQPTKTFRKSIVMLD